MFLNSFLLIISVKIKYSFVDNKRLNECVAKMNNKFIAKEVKKIIRFKFGMTQILDLQLESATRHVELLKAQRKLIDLIPEAYDKEALRNNKVSVGNSARNIVIDYHECKNFQNSNGSNSGKSREFDCVLNEINDAKKALNANEINDISNCDPTTTSDLQSSPCFSPLPKLKECSCLGYLCDVHNSTLSHCYDSTDNPSFLMQTPTAADGSQFFYSEMAKNCSNAILRAETSASSMESNRFSDGNPNEACHDDIYFKNTSELQNLKTHPQHFTQHQQHSEFLNQVNDATTIISN